MVWTGLSRYRDSGLLLLRIAIGAMFILFGTQKLLAGPTLWGGLATSVGIPILPTAFGFIASLSEAVGGLLLALGLLFRPACMLLAAVMIGATWSHVQAGHSFAQWSRPGELLVLFVALILIGPGRYSIDRK